ncbi:MAG: ankyrin repeat domain-containing protein [Cytophagales bacterium]|nr:ankyrin repeat domain-containing protein [Cytophagales bacterium]
MKNRNRLHIDWIIQLTFCAFILSLAACKENKASAQSSAKSGMRAPNIDIHTAVLTDNREVVKEHIEAGSDLNEIERIGGSSPLISAALFGKKEIAKMLIQAGADLNLQNNDGSTALITAAFFCRPEIVKMLIDKKADMTLKNRYNQTAYDAVAGSFESVKPSYEMLGQMLQPMGLKLDFEYLEKTRPEIASLLK